MFEFLPWTAVLIARKASRAVAHDFRALCPTEVRLAQGIVYILKKIYKSSASQVQLDAHALSCITRFLLNEYCYRHNFKACKGPAEYIPPVLLAIGLGSFTNAIYFTSFVKEGQRDHMYSQDSLWVAVVNDWWR